jgi:hypothetical protein
MRHSLPRSLHTAAAASALTLAAWLHPSSAVSAQGGVVSRDSAITTRIAQRGVVRGVVRDSLLGGPLARALVQLVATDAPTPYGVAVETDSLGQYRITGVPVGRYTVGFLHPRLDSLGLEPPVHGVEIGSSSDVRADLAIPGAHRFRSAVCGTRSGTMLMGFVRQADNLAPVSGATLEAAWLELRIDKQGVGNRLLRRTSVSSKNGWFVFCNVPSPGNVSLRVTAGADTIDAVEFEMAGNAVERRELYIGPSRIREVRDSVREGDSLVVRTSRLRVGDATLRGAIVRADNGRPLANAQVSVLNGPSTRTNERGEWIIADAPAGTRVIEARAVGYFPLRTTLNVTANGDAPLMALSSNKSVLESVKVRANYWRYADLKGFRARQRTFPGRFYNQRDIDARAAKTASDLLMSMSGVLIEYGENGDRFFYQKTPGALGHDRCIPTVYLNGAELRGLDASTLDTFINPTRVIALEIYQAGMAPSAFQSAFTGCGSLVFWTQ